MWSLAASYLVDLASKGSNIDSRAYVTNLVGILAPFVVLAFTVAYSILGGRAYRDAVRTFERIDTILSASGAAWTQGDEITSLPYPPMSLFDAFEIHLKRIESTWRANYLLQGITGTLLLLVLLAVAIPYLYGLDKSIKEMKSMLGSSGRDEGNQNYKQLRSAWLVSPHCIATTRVSSRSLILTSNTFFSRQALVTTLSMFATCATVQSALNYVVVAYPFSLQDPKWSQAILFVPFFSTGILGLPCAWLLFWRALKAKPERNQDSALWPGTAGLSTRRSGAGANRSGSESVAGQRETEGGEVDGDARQFAREEWIAVLGRNDTRAGDRGRKELEKGIWAL